MTFATFAPAARPAAIPIRELLPGSFSPAFFVCSASISSARRRARLRSSRACTCMNSCTTAAICSASPATNGAANSDSGSES